MIIGAMSPGSGGIRWRIGEVNRDRNTDGSLRTARRYIA
jgi:hypothetical protein